ncbi:ABC transporter substrate-binding protein [Bradyrhizobium sp. U87765 SZCCT0131]|uniref:ABC transporter substrate-binding protein n=1 Tax=unclassified Bradyrhizobium TaxID=2631580 RepID=UPI001BAE2A78|nr:MULTISPECIES: ABC transporter substrate-binding protein [unclassified Bradyrhizobium]MBR1218326.1 ABC transporter substrate-binding protein [Bradyrhizobium sp. U87765 SZCCT0131]MBR1260728.1 ABC transporter substrate-binding protein [Bradyrhizobium sp. U87765 SZCCT0134]MBR1303824.1 ABC transporter substrate-binding protein [Bradyrhizobium sp. U87765 SZCCT0110]MBR1319430.1 ABC transporter substrate-binding protein [Bradyrhizobium sp. U87765 SZCCT0109]MBR1347755.1 ABC transporter substrate-bin
MALRIRKISRRHLLAAAGAVLSLAALSPAFADDVVKFGLVAAMSGQSAKSGEAIVRGLSVAIDEINAKGGLLGKKVVLVVRDDESNPAKGVVAARELAQREQVAAIFGGLDTPVSMAIVPFANQARIPFVGVWAAGTPITRNGAAENYVFRVSAVDALVDVALVNYAEKKYGAKKPGMILINNSWGESNEKGLKTALDDRKIPSAGVEKFETADVDVVPQLTRLKEAGADALFLVANVAPSAQVVKSLDRMGWDVPVVSHWGPSGGRFTELAGASAEKVHFIQTFSFSGNSSPKAQAVFAALKAKYPEIKSYADVTPAVGIANAYDAAHLTALAIAKAGSTEGPKVRDGFYGIDSYAGLIKTYARPFSPQNQDALSADDYIFTHFKGDEILPLTN